MSPKSKSKAPPCTEADKQAVHVWLTHKLDISQRALTRLKALCDETNPDTWEEKTLHHWSSMVTAYSYALENNSQRKVTDG
jgi:hypothetical protein